MSFSIERFVSLSKAVETNDLDWDYIAKVGITDDEAKVLRYMGDTESHTIIYLRDVLSGSTAKDPEITAFLSCWVYEEFNHGRAIDRFLTACGYAPERDRFAKVTEQASWVESFEAFLTTNLPKLTSHFAAVHMAWGALDEMMAASAYTQLAGYTQNRELAKLLMRMARDERRHQSFYYHQAEKRMQHPFGRMLARFAIYRFWSPVGIGVGGDDDALAFIGCMLYDHERGADELRHMDRMMARLPGLENFDLAYQGVTSRMAALRQRYPGRVAHLRGQADGRDAKPDFAAQTAAAIAAEAAAEAAADARVS
jgi:hypothetical protein